MRKIISLLTQIAVRIIGKKRIIQYAFTTDETRAYDMLGYGYLKDNGWWDSFRQHKPVDENNNPLPWTTYSFIDFIKDRLSSDLEMFEFGCGNSTIFFAKKVKHITSVEHEKSWYDIVSEKKPSNSKIILAENNSVAYCTSISKENKQFDIIFNDGLFRNECTKEAVSCLSHRGVIIIDDSERTNNNAENYNESFELLKENGFKRIDFWGFSPSCFYKKATTVFYKPGNCLNI